MAPILHLNQRSQYRTLDLEHISKRNALLLAGKRVNSGGKTVWKRKAARKGKSTPLLLLEEVRNLGQLQLVHPNRWHFFSLNPVMTERMRTGAQRMQVLKDVKSCISQVTLSMKMTVPLVSLYCKDHAILCMRPKMIQQV